MPLVKLNKVLVVFLIISVIFVSSACGRRSNIPTSEVQSSSITGSQNGAQTTGQDTSQLGGIDTLGNADTVQNIRLEVRGVFVAEPDSNGWKQVTIPLIASSSATTAIFAGAMCGVLVDTGGYEHKVQVQKASQVLRHLPSIRTTELFAYSLIPQNQDVKSLTLYQDYESQFEGSCQDRLPGEPWVFDLTAPPNDVAIPVDDVETLSENGILEYEMPNAYRLQIYGAVVEENQFYEGSFYWAPKWHIENIGGHNLRFRTMGSGNQGFIEPILAIVDDKGKYMEVDLQLSDANGIGPGIKKEREYFSGVPIEEFADSEWIIQMLVVGNTVTEPIWTKAPTIPDETSVP